MRNSYQAAQMIKTRKRYQEIDERAWYILTFNQETQLWAPRKLAAAVGTTYVQIRQSVTRLRDAGAAILNRGGPNGNWYVPRIGQVKWVREDIAARRKVARNWDTRTDMMEASANTRLQIVEEIQESTLLSS